MFMHVVFSFQIFNEGLISSCFIFKDVNMGENVVGSCFSESLMSFKYSCDTIEVNSVIVFIIYN